jgi:hypothetical protein
VRDDHAVVEGASSLELELVERLEELVRFVLALQDDGEAEIVVHERKIYRDALAP